MIFLASFFWVVVCVVATLLSVYARRESHFFITDGILSKSFLIWMMSMLTLDIGVIFVGVMVGYNPPFLALVMFLFIQAIYILLTIVYYTRSRIEGDRFNVVYAKKNLRSAPIMAIFLCTVVLTVSFGYEPSIVTTLPAFALATLLWLLN